MLFGQARRVAERSLWANGFSPKLSIRWCWAVLLHIKHPAPSFFTLFPNYDIMKYKLKDIALSQMGLPFRSRMEPDTDGNVAVIQMRDLTEDKLDYRTLMTVNINDLNERHLVQYKDLICRTRGQNTTATIIDQEPGQAVVAAPLFLIRATSNKCSTGISVLVYQPVLISSISPQQSNRNSYNYDWQIGSRCFGDPTAQSGNTSANRRPRRFAK